MKNKVLIGITSEGTVELDMMNGVADLCRRDDTTLVTFKGRPLDHVRNNMARVLLENAGFTHLLMLDCDMGFPANLLTRLLELNAPVVSGLYAGIIGSQLLWVCGNWGEDGKVHFYEWLDLGREPFEADCSGAGCLLIRREVFERLEYPWFRFEESKDGGLISEDIYFCRKLNAAGMKVTVNPKILCRHFKKVDLAEVMLKANEERIRMKVV